MRVRFWGTRGSLPVSLAAEDIKNKIVEALLAAAGRNLKSRADIDAFVERDLPFAISHTYGGNSSCVELDIGTARAASQESMKCKSPQCAMRTSSWSPSPGGSIT